MATRNPIPSEAPEDLVFNAGKIDEEVNSDAEYYVDRFDKHRLTNEGRNKLSERQRNEWDTRLQSIAAQYGWREVPYVAGNVLELRTDYVEIPGEGGYSLNYDVPLPYTLTGDWATESINFTRMSDATLRADLADPEKGPTIIPWVGIVNPIYYGADPMGSSLSTKQLQQAIDSLPDWGTLDLQGGTYRVNKNTDLQGFPSNDQPCLLVRGKNNVRIINGEIFVSEHGQGVLEIRESVGVLVSCKITGPKNFPQMDGTTGRAEKGVPTAGYYDPLLYASPEKRNNSYDTTMLSTGGFNGSFPQWGGGVGNVWGIWNGGYIQNYGHGVYIEDSVQTLIVESDISGFNGTGVTMGGGSSALVYRSKIYDCYTGGVIAYQAGQPKDSDYLTIDDCDIYNIGHPDSMPTDSTVDPGYGTSTSNATTSFLKKYIIRNNRIRNCKRKAVDAHHAIYVASHDNTIQDCGQGIIIIPGSSSDFQRADIFRNNISGLRMPLGDEVIAILVSPDTSQFRSGIAFIHENRVEDCGFDLGGFNQYSQIQYARLLYAEKLEAAHISDNYIKNNSEVFAAYAILLGLGVNSPSYFFVSKNTIIGSFEAGIGAQNPNGEVSNNNIKLLSPLPLTTPIPNYGITGATSKILDNKIEVANDPNLYMYNRGNNVDASAVFSITLPAGAISLVRSNGISAQGWSPIGSVELLPSSVRLKINRAYPWPKTAQVGVSSPSDTLGFVSCSPSDDNVSITIRRINGDTVNPSSASGRMTVTVGF